MTEQGRVLAAHEDDPLVAVHIGEDGDESVRYAVADSPDPSLTRQSIQAAMAAIGSCSDLDWRAWADELDRLRHENGPTPPVDV